MIWLVSPVVIFGIVWVSQTLAYAALPLHLIPPETETWYIVAAGYISLIFGSLAFSVFNRLEMTDLCINKEPKVGLVSVSPRLLYSTITLSFLAALFLFISIEKNEIGFLHSLKEVLLAESLTGSKEFTYIGYIFIYQVLLTLYYFNVEGFKKDLKTAGLIAAGVLGSCMSGSRALTIFFIVALVPCLINKKHEINVTPRLVVTLLIIGVASFFLYPLVFQGMSLETGINWPELIDYMSIYCFSGIAAFGDFVKTNTPNYDCILMVPRPILYVFDGLQQANWLTSCPVSFEEKLIPISTNVYSIFFAPYHDFGISGVVVYLFVIGFISQMSFTKGCLQKSDVWRFLYGILFYSLILSFFEDQFLRGAIYYFFGLAVFISTKIIKR